MHRGSIRACYLAIPGSNLIADKKRQTHKKIFFREPADLKLSSLTQKKICKCCPTNDFKIGLYLQICFYRHVLTSLLKQAYFKIISCLKCCQIQYTHSCFQSQTPTILPEKHDNIEFDNTLGYK